jgi:branched-chain amino acid transport system permease protein
MFGFAFVTLALSMLLLGGTSTIWGPIIDAFIFTFISEFMINLGEWRSLIIGTLIVLVLRYYPAGILSLLDRVGGEWFRPSRASASAITKQTSSA